MIHGSENQILSDKNFARAASELTHLDVNTDRPSDDHTRGLVLSQAFDFLTWAVKGDQVIIKSRQGRVLLTAKENQGSKIVDLRFVPDQVGPASNWNCAVMFWMNADSLSSLSDRLRTNPEHRVLFHEIFEGTRKF
jgi:hypothetical protein